MSSILTRNMVTAFSEKKKMWFIVWKNMFIFNTMEAKKKNHFEIKIEKSKMLVTIAPQTHGEQSLFFYLW